jgi:hypothetical protein
LGHRCDLELNSGSSRRFSIAFASTLQKMRRDTACLLIGRPWVGGLGAYSWVGILRLLLSRPTHRLLRELASRFGSFFYGDCKLWTLRQVLANFIFSFFEVRKGQRVVSFKFA